MLRWLASAFRGTEALVTQSVFVGVLYTASGLASALAIQWMIDTLIPRRVVVQVIAAGALLIALQVLRALLGLLRRRFVQQLSERVGVSVGTGF